MFHGNPYGYTGDLCRFINKRYRPHMLDYCYTTKITSSQSNLSIFYLQEKGELCNNAPFITECKTVIEGNTFINIFNNINTHFCVTYA